MGVQSIKRQLRLREWAAQVDKCMQSGLPVKQWCEKNGIAKKTYYYRLNRVREELLDAMEIGNALRLPEPAQVLASGAALLSETAVPEFATLPLAKGKGAAATVWIGECAVDIHNGADGAVVEQVLRVVSGLC